MATTSAPEPRGGRSTRAAAALSEQLFARHHRMVAGLCRALLRDLAEAEDATQQAFLSAHRALLNGAEPREPAAWLATIARNECWSRIRGRMREPLATDELDTVAGDGDPLAEAIRRADLAALWQAIEALPRTQRDALLLREFGGLRYDELAAALAVSEPAVESLLVRARTRLRAQLKAAYAALTGASWLDALARLAAGGAAPAAATKAAVVGLGAAAVTGGAVFAPHVLRQSPHHRLSPAKTRPVPAAVATRPTAPPPVAAAVSLPARPVAQAVATGREHEQADGNRGDRSGSDGGAETTTASGEHEQAVETEPNRSGSDGGRGHSRSGGGGDHGEDAPPATTTETGPILELPTVTTAEIDVAGEGSGGGEGGEHGGAGPDEGP